MKDLLRRTGTGILLVVLFAGSILAGPWPFLVMILLVFLLGHRELLNLYVNWNTSPGILLSVSGVLLILVIFTGLMFRVSPWWLILPLLPWTAGALIPGIRGLSSSGKENWAAARLTLFWLSLPLASFYALGWAQGDGYSPVLPLSVIALVWLFDTFSYLTGSLLGRHQMTPRLSPGKTWEGTIGGVLLTLACGWTVYRITETYSLTIWLVVSVMISVLGLTGDLFESGLKRKKKVKDMGSLLPGHGGIMDRFDSLLLVAPALLLLYVIINLFT